MLKFHEAISINRISRIIAVSAIIGIGGAIFEKIDGLSGTIGIFTANAQTTNSGKDIAPSREGGYGLGRTALPEEIAAWDIDIRPDGLGLPSGSGDVFTGEEVWIEKCASCHGDFGEAIDRWPIIAGGFGTLDGEDPVKTVGSYWPYLSTAWDYVHRAMPFGDAQTLTDDEVYALVAYILYSNDLVDDEFVLSKETFLDVEMPNADGFYMDDRVETEYSLFNQVPCMENCKETVEITARARIIDVTPEDENVESGESAAERVAEEEPAEEGSNLESLPQSLVASLDEELVEDGARVFKKCKACHQIGENAKNRVGPHLNEIVERQVGIIEEFRYSKVMAKAGDDGLIWSEEVLTEYLRNPKKYMKGTKMAFAGLKKDKDIIALLEFLKAESH